MFHTEEVAGVRDGAGEIGGFEEHTQEAEGAVAWGGLAVGEDNTGWNWRVARATVSRSMPVTGVDIVCSG